jgi:hypothetical protein
VNLFLPGLIVGFILGVFALVLLTALYLLHRPRYVAPTKHRRQWRDRLPEVHNVPPMPVCKVAREEGGDLQDAILAAARKSGNSRFVWETEQKLKQHEDVVRYEWINLTGEER